MKRLLLLALPALLAGCPSKDPTKDATATATAPAAPAAPAAATEPVKTADNTAAKVEFANPGVIRSAGTLPKYQWRLVDATDAKGQRIDVLMTRPDRPVTLEFRDGKLGIGNTCNRMNASYGLAAGKLTVAKTAGTKKACLDPALMGLDGEVGKRLEGPLGVRLSKGDARQLELTNAAGDVLVFAGTAVAAEQPKGQGKPAKTGDLAAAKPSN